MEDRPDNTKNALIFQHIPKTACSTLRALFNKRYSNRNAYNVFASSHADQEAEKLRKHGLSERCKIEILKGQMPFGSHKCLPKTS